jgi:hypothetical protein
MLPSVAEQAVTWSVAGARTQVRVEACCKLEVIVAGAQWRLSVEKKVTDLSGFTAIAVSGAFLDHRLGTRRRGRMSQMPAQRPPATGFSASPMAMMFVRRLIADCGGI